MGKRETPRQFKVSDIQGRATVSCWSDLLPFCKGSHVECLGASAPVYYLAAILVYVSAEIPKLAGNVARFNSKTRIIPHHLLLAVRNDEELNKLLADVTLSQGGVLPNIEV